MKRTTFTKKPAKRGALHVPGTQPSLHNGLLLVSTGIPTLDSVLGGGLPVGSVFLVEEDVHNRFAKIMLKYFLAEGVVCKHDLLLSSADENPQTIIDHLPKPTSTIPKIKSIQKTSDDMKIAFMYKDLPKNTSSLSTVSNYGHYYDISSTMDKSLLDECKVQTLNLSDECLGLEEKDLFRSTMNYIQNVVDNCSLYKAPTSVTPDTRVNVLRIGLPSLSSPLWCENTQENTYRISRFLHCLRALARNSLLVCMVTMPTHLYNSSQVAVFRQLVDCSVELEAFIGEKNPVFKQYHGIFKIHKLPCLNSLVSFVPESFDLAFELKRTKFSIECLHLPPDVSETASRQGMDEVGNKLTTSSPCGGTTLNKKLDF